MVEARKGGACYFTTVFDKRSYWTRSWTRKEIRKHEVIFHSPTRDLFVAETMSDPMGMYWLVVKMVAFIRWTDEATFKEDLDSMSIIPTVGT